MPRRYLLPILWHVNCRPHDALHLPFPSEPVPVPSAGLCFHGVSLCPGDRQNGDRFVDQTNKTISLAVHDPWRQPEIIVRAFHRDLPFEITETPLLCRVLGILGQIPWLKRTRRLATPTPPFPVSQGRHLLHRPPIFYPTYSTLRCFRSFIK